MPSLDGAFVATRVSEEEECPVPGSVCNIYSVQQRDPWNPNAEYLPSPSVGFKCTVGEPVFLKRLPRVMSRFKNGPRRFCERAKAKKAACLAKRAWMDQHCAGHCNQKDRRAQCLRFVHQQLCLDAKWGQWMHKYCGDQCHEQLATEGGAKAKEACKQLRERNWCLGGKSWMEKHCKDSCSSEDNASQCASHAAKGRCRNSWSKWMKKFCSARCKREMR
jgi:hypothetical protein